MIAASCLFSGVGRYAKFLFQVHDSIQVDISSGKVQDVIKFDSGNLCMITGGRNTGRVGTIMSRERHPGSFDIVHVKDANGHVFATRLGYTFIIGKLSATEALFWMMLHLT